MTEGTRPPPPGQGGTPAAAGDQARRQRGQQLGAGGALAAGITLAVDASRRGWSPAPRRRAPASAGARGAGRGAWREACGRGGGDGPPAAWQKAARRPALSRPGRLAGR